MYGMREADHYSRFPDGGGYPKGFLRHAFGIMGVMDPAHVLHVCSGSLRSGVRVDCRATVQPSVQADGCHLPFRDAAFSWVLVDPPYSREYAQNLYGTPYPNPHQLAQEAIRVLRPGGYMGFMHHMIPKVARPGRLCQVFALSQGMGYNIRAWTLFTRER